MKGLELSEKYWNEIGRPAFERACPGILDYAAVGLAGEGSDCFGYDDEISRDHDWGPGFCLWLNDEGFARFGERAKAVYAYLPDEYMGFRRENVTPETAWRVGVMTVREFMLRCIGTDCLPRSIDDWRRIPEECLAMVTNGRIFHDGCGEITEMRTALAGYYPEALRLKKLAAHCALAAQAGQYNYPRCRRREEGVAAMLAMAKFTEHIQSAVFLLNRAYKPYYKWTNRRLRELPVLGAGIASGIEGLTVGSGNKTDKIERLCVLLADELRREGLTDSDDDFLLLHAQQIQDKIQDETLRNMHLMAE